MTQPTGENADNDVRLPARQHNIGATVQTIRIDEINDAFLKVKSGKVRYRYVIDVANSFQAA